MKRHAWAKRRDRRKAERMLKRGIIREPHRNERLKGHHTVSRVGDTVTDVRELPPGTRAKKAEMPPPPPLVVPLGELWGEEGE